ncbi:MAG: hypothetical protein JSS51_15145 [Planctomycetes bacterium]|nr:hypothetical protein [Planctomycetota bacterium]
MKMSSTIGLVLASGMACVCAADQPQAETQTVTTSVVAEPEQPVAPALQSADEPWKFVVAPYLWIPAQHGTVAKGIVRANVSMSVGDTWNTLWDNFKFAGCIHLEAVHKQWSIFGDVMYMDLGNDVKNLPINVGYQSGIFELGAGYAVHNGPLPGAEAGSPVKLRLEPIAGVRMWYLDATVSTPINSRGSTETWVDGFGGLRAELAFNETFSISGRADVGTGMSELTWNALAMLNINLSQNIALFAGWRWLSDDYHTGSGLDRFEYDMMYNGPFAGVKITF